MAHLRVLVALARPSVVILLALFAELGLAVAGHGEDHALVAQVLVVVVAFLLTSVLVNDLADEEIDRVNLAGDASRPLVSGRSTRRTFVAMAVASAAVALGASALLGPAELLVVVAGLGLSLSYSLRPLRLSARGALASLLLPAGYVAVPFLVGVLAARGSVGGSDLVVLAGLYVGFIGRILLKDFRDVRGDALFGKRTFLIRHGRRWTCAISAVCWVLGSLTLAGVADRSPTLALAYAAYLSLALVLLRALALDGGPRRDTSLISAIAIVGRMTVVTLIAHLTTTQAGWTPAASGGLLLVLAAITVGQVVTMVRVGPRSGLTVPAAWAAAPSDLVSVGQG